MKGSYAFCPKTGVPLSEEKHYDHGGGYQRVPEAGATDATPAAELTNGSRRSSTVALCVYFRRTHQRHDAPDDALYREAALALRRLKRTATETQAWDVYVWFTLAERLSRTGHDVAWMHDHAEWRCPGCYGPLRYDAVGDGVAARCVQACDGDRGDRLASLHATVAALYRATFDDRVAATDLHVGDR